MVWLTHGLVYAFAGGLMEWLTRWRVYERGVNVERVRGLVYVLRKCC